MLIIPRRRALVYSETVKLLYRINVMDEQQQVEEDEISAEQMEGDIMTGATCGAGNANSSGTPDLAFGFCEEYHVAFNFFDTNKDGTISTDELRVIMQRLGMNPTEEEMEIMIADVDDNGNGSLEFPEFVKMMEKRRNTNNEEEELMTAFRMFDGDGNGFLDLAELKIAMTSLGEKMTEDEVKEMIHEADKNNDGLIDYTEFVTMMTGQPPKPENLSETAEIVEPDPSVCEQ